MAVQTEQETLNMLKTLLDLIEKKAEVTGAKLRELKDRELTHQEMQEWLRFLRGITDDGKIVPRSALFKAEEKDRLDYITYQAKLHNKEELFKVLTNDDGTFSLLTNNEGMEFFAYYTELFDISHPDRAGEIREVSLANDIAAGIDDRSKTIIKGLSESQYLALTKKVYSAEDKFTFAASMHEKDGIKTYDVVVNSKNFMYGDKVNEKLGANDLFTTIIVEDSFRNEESELAIKNEAKLMDKILNYNGDAPMYVSQLLKGDEFLEVTKDKVTIINRNGGKIEIDKTSLDTKSFQVNVLRHFDKFSMPFELTDEICDKLKIDKANKYDICLNHARTGRDDDFTFIEKGKVKYPIPVNRNEIYNSLINFKKEFTRIIKKIELDAYKEYTNDYITKSKDFILKNVCPSIDGFETLSLKDKEAIFRQYQDNIKSNIKEFNPAKTNCNWEKVQTKSFNDALEAYNKANEASLKLHNNIVVPDEINDVLRNSSYNFNKTINELTEKMREGREAYNEFAKKIESDKMELKLNALTTSTSLNVLNSKFIEDKYREAVISGNDLNRANIMAADIIAKEIIKTNPSKLLDVNELSADIYNDYINKTKFDVIMNNVKEKYDVNIDAASKTIPEKPIFNEYIFKYSNETKDTYNVNAEYASYINKYTNIEKSINAAEKELSINSEKYKEEVAVWYEESFSKLALTGNGDELAVAYVKNLVYSEDSGPLSAIPDKLNGSVEAFSNMEIEHTVIDYKGVCIDEEHKDKKLYDLMGYDQMNLTHDESISSMNIARATNKNVQNTNERLYKSTTLSSPEIGDR